LEMECDSEHFTFGTPSSVGTHAVVVSAPASPVFESHNDDYNDQQSSMKQRFHLSMRRNDLNSSSPLSAALQVGRTTFVPPEPMLAMSCSFPSDDLIMLTPRRRTSSCHSNLMPPPFLRGSMDASLPLDRAVPTSILFPTFS
jgi:hypothetical protein